MTNDRDLYLLSRKVYNSMQKFTYTVGIQKKDAEYLIAF